MSRCVECGLPIVIVDGHREHPSCDPHDPAAARIRADHAARQAGVEGQLQAATGSPDDFALALDIIRRTACLTKVFSANSISDPNSPHYDERWSQLSNKVPGAAMGTASRRRWCRKTGRTVPAGGNGNGHAIPEWESLIFVDEFAVGLSAPGRGAA